MHYGIVRALEPCGRSCTRPNRLGFFEDAGGISVWIDRNLDPDMVWSIQRGGRWSYVFREAVRSLWIARNKALFEEDNMYPGVHVIAA